jgi:hypothetical protein
MKKTYLLLLFLLAGAPVFPQWQWANPIPTGLHLVKLSNCGSMAFGKFIKD